MMEPFIALDWGTTRVRAALIDGNGVVVEERLGESGVGELDATGFGARFSQLTDGWKASYSIACGMIGSRQGWSEAAYMQCPAPLAGLSKNLASVATDKGMMYIVPGLTVQRSTGSHDVMRGEESQLAGLLSHHPEFTGTIVLPGTHSKWVKMRDGVVVDFLSFMTGDLYEAISNHTLLQHSIDQHRDGWSEAAFLVGVEAALQSAGAIWSRLFGIRADSLIEGPDDRSQREYLSGLLIGSEFASARTEGFDADDLVIIGGEKMIAIYEIAARASGHQTQLHKGTDLVWPALTMMMQRNMNSGD